MSGKKYSDAITFEKPLFKEIYDTEVLNCFKNENLMQILKILRKNYPMTPKEIHFEFEKWKKKSLKSVYRYLKRLERRGLILKAGKRVYEEEKNVLTTTSLYSRTAKIFFPIKQAKDTTEHIDKEKKTDKEADTIYQGLKVLFESKYDKQLKSIDCIKCFVSKAYSFENETTRQLIKKNEQELTEIMLDWEWDQIESFVTLVGLLIILTSDHNWKKELMQCFS